MTEWPDSDEALTARMAATPARLLHVFMCECAEHALLTCAPLATAGKYLSLPDRAPIDVKRQWLAGEATDGDLEAAQYAGVRECYWGNPIALGAAILGTAWYPGSGIAVAEDEAYAESMTYYPDACAAAKDVMRQCVRAVSDLVHAAAFASKARAAVELVDGEAAWQRERFLVITADLT